MTKTIVALYDDFSTAERVIDNLLEAGFEREDISIMANDASGTFARDEDLVTDGDVSASEGAGFGAIVGGLIGVGIALIPGIGPVLGAGPLAVALTAGIGAAAGAITGGITAGLIDMGVDEEDAHVYAEGVRRGGTLLSVATNDQWAERAEQIMNRYHPVDIDTRSTLWREGGWASFDSGAQPYSTDQIEHERLAYRDYNVPHGMGTIEDVRELQSPGSLENPPGAERHHETSRAVDAAMNPSSVEVDRNARRYPGETSGKQDTNPNDVNNLNR